MKNKVFWLILLIIVILRVVLSYTYRQTFPDGTKVKITQKIVSEPVQYSDSQYFRVSNLKIYLPKYPKISYGDVIVVEGMVEGDKVTNSRLVEVKNSNNFLYSFREKLIAFYTRSLPSPHASLISGVVLGSKSSIDENFWTSLVATGTAHVVVASGMNVTLVAKFLISTLVVFLKRRLAIPLAIVGVMFYSVLSGFDAPIIRATIMGVLVFTAQEFGKMYSAGRILVISALIMLLLWPDWLFDIGFILSFTATASLIIFEKRVGKRLKFVPSLIREDLSTTLSAQIGVAPIIFVTFGQFNFLSPFINTAVLWTIPLITMIGMIAGLTGMLFEPLGRLMLFMAYPLTSWFIRVVKHAG